MTFCQVYIKMNSEHRLVIKNLDVFGVRILGFFLLLILIHNCPIKGFQFTKFLYIISFLYFFIVRKKFSKHQKILLIFGAFLASYGVAMSMIMGAADINIFNFSRLFSCLFASVFIVDLLKYKANFKEITIVNWIALTGIFEAIIVLLGFFNTGFHDFLIDFIGGTERYQEKMNAMGAFRGIGWSYTQYSDFAVPQGMAFLCFIIAYINIHNKLNSIEKIGAYLLLILFIGSGILIGRTYQFIIIVAFILYCFSYKFECSNNFLSWNLFKFGLLSTLILISGISILDDYIPEETYNWAFELFINMSNSKISTASTDDLQTMWVFPDSWNDWIFGVGRFSPLNENSHPTFSKSDVGIVNSIFYWGIIGSIFYYLCIYLTFYYCIKDAENTTTKYLAFSLLCVILIYNLKGLGNGFAFSALLLQGIHEAKNKPCNSSFILYRR